MKTDLVNEFERQLREARKELLRTVTVADEELATLETHQPGELTEDVNRELVARVLSRLEGQERRELDEIEEARGRLAAGTFGVCEGCGSPIPLTRLRAMPTARGCVPCQRKVEKSGGGPPDGSQADSIPCEGDERIALENAVSAASLLLLME